MNHARWLILSGLLAFGSLAPPAQAQVRAPAAPPGTFYGYGSNGYGYYYYPRAPLVYAPRADYVRAYPPSTANQSSALQYHRDWTTGRTNLPLSRPWTRPLR